MEAAKAAVAGRTNGSAVGPADRLHARTSLYQRRVARALDIIREALTKGALGVSFSGGKDSLVTLDLVRQVIPDTPAALFDSGCELAATHALAADYGVQVIRPRLTAVEMARYAGWWGYPDPVDRDCPFQLKAVIIDEPSETFVVSRRLRAIAIGLRSEESAARRMNRRAHGTLYQGRDRTWYCTPIADWTADDVWAYIASRDLRYHPAYDVMTTLGIPRARARLGMLLGATAEALGSFALLRRIEPQTFARLAAEFPDIRNAS